MPDILRPSFAAPMRIDTNVRNVTEAGTNGGAL